MQFSDYKVGLYEECLESAAMGHSTDSLPDRCRLVFYMARQDLQR